MEKLTAFLKSRPGARILDVGTGAGNFVGLLTELDDKFGEIIGIDTSEGSIRAAEKNFADGPNIHFFKMDALKMDFPDASFDVVCLSNSLHHLTNARTVLAEMTRVLKADGVMLLNEMISDHLSVQQLSHRKLHHFAAEIDRECGQCHDDTYTRAHILALLKRETTLTIADAWDMVLPAAGEPTQADIDSLKTTVDRLQGRIKDESRLAYYRQKGERIKNYIQKHNFASATQLLVLLRSR